MANWHELSVKNVLKVLGTSTRGLSGQEAEKRIRSYGRNELVKEKGISKFSIFVEQFRSILVIILIAATIISFLIGETIDAIAILVIVVLNAIFGFIQEYKAEKTIDALKRLASPEATVIRDNRETRIPASELVPGDVVVLQEGDRVPADIRLISASELYIDESSLTGESRPVQKTTSAAKSNVIAERKCMAFMGTLVTSGRGIGVVVSTGMSTEMGRIAHMVQERKEEKTPLQKKLDVFGRNLGIIILFVCALVVIVGILKEGVLIGLPYSEYPKLLIKMFMTGISLAVAAIPEGLPAVVTITLAIGLRKLSSKNALMRKLPVVETLGSTTVICSDKTGTLTKNEMTVNEIWYHNKIIKVTGNGYNTTGEFVLSGKPINPLKTRTLSILLRTSVLCNNSSIYRKNQITGDPTEAALLVVAAKAGTHKTTLEEQYPRTNEIPFTSKRKMMTVINKKGKKYIISSKGAAEKILPLCEKIYDNGKVRKLTKNDRIRILDNSRKMAGKPLRVLAFAYKESDTPYNPEKSLIFIGLAGMTDPPREGVKHDINLCKKAGIKVVMITGDHEDTARAVATELEIFKQGDKVLTGKELSSLSDEKLASIVERVSVYARVDPEHKIRIVDAFKKRGHIIAMTGDGVNDAPALKGADIGISMGIKGTDVAKEASDMILTDDNFRSIVSAVKEGRVIYDNIKKFIQYLLSSNIGEVLIVFVAMMIGLVDPKTGLILLPIQLLWINILTDALPALALGVDPPAPDIMKRKPRDPKEKILSRPMLIDIAFVGVLMCIATLLLFWFTLPFGGTLAMTIAFTSIVLFEMVRVQAVRMKFRIGIFSNKKLIVSIMISIILQLLVVYVPALNFVFRTVPLGFAGWSLILSASASMMLLMWIKDKYFSSGMW